MKPNKILMLCLLTSSLLFYGCASSQPSAAEKALGGLAVAVQGTQTAVTALTTKLDEEADKLAALGAPVDSGFAATAKWAWDNPATAATSGGGLLAVLAALAAGYKRKKAKASALNAIVDTIEALPSNQPITKEAILSDIAKHPQMGATARIAVADVNAR